MGLARRLSPFGSSFSPMLRPECVFGGYFAAFVSYAHFRFITENPYPSCFCDAYEYEGSIQTSFSSSSFSVRLLSSMLRRMGLVRRFSPFGASLPPSHRPVAPSCGISARWLRCARLFWVGVLLGVRGAASALALRASGNGPAPPPASSHDPPAHPKIKEEGFA